jgi:hypothetical protein
MTSLVVFGGRQHVAREAVQALNEPTASVEESRELAVRWSDHDVMVGGDSHDA